MFNIIGYRYIFFTISGLLVMASIAAIAVYGLPLGIDFTGGSLMELEYRGPRPPLEEIRATFTSMELGNALVQPTGEKGVLIWFPHITEEQHQALLTRLSATSSPQLVPGEETQPDGGGGNPVTGITEKRFDTIGPTIGQELKQRAALALGFALLCIIGYIAWVFRRVSRPVSSWKYGVVAVIALIHDVMIPAGVFAVLGRYLNVEIDALFITALLTIVGFSVHDTIVVFDRVREHLRKSRGGESFETLVNISVNETISRSINTSVTALLMLAALFLFGGATTMYFVLALMIGIVVGVYSSIFIASPLLVAWQRWGDR